MASGDTEIVLQIFPNTQILPPPLKATPTPPHSQQTITTPLAHQMTATEGRHQNMSLK